MLKRSIIIASVILVICLAIGFPVCRGRLLSAKLVEAVEHKNSDLVENLLDKGANPDAKDKDGAPLLILAVSEGNKKITQLLLAKGADADASLPDTGFTAGLTALHFARKPEIIELLLAKGANINARSNDGTTPLHMAAILGSADAIRVLLERGAEADARENRWGRTPLHDAAMSDEPETVKQLILHGANVDARDKFNITPLYWAVSRGICGNPNTKKPIIIFGVDVNDERYEHYRRLAEAEPSYFEICIKQVQLLLDNGADVNAKNIHDKTALHCASEIGHRSVVEMLLKYGADINAKDDEGKTPLDTATRKGHSEIAKLLVEHGAKTSAELN